MLEFPRSHHFGLYEGMWLSLLSSDRSSFWHTSPRKELADNDENHYTLYIQHGDTHTQFQIKTANICFHFFSCTKYKNYNVSSFWASQKLRSNVSKTGFDLGSFSELRFENWVLRLKFWGTVNLLFSSTTLYFHLWQQKTALWLQGHICLRKISAAKQTHKLNELWIHVAFYFNDYCTM